MGANQPLVDAVVHAYMGMPISEQDALALLNLLGMEPDEADDLLTATREEASQP